jgi:hypothetical protein
LKFYRKKKKKIIRNSVARLGRDIQYKNQSRYSQQVKVFASVSPLSKLWPHVDGQNIMKPIRWLTYHFNFSGWDGEGEDTETNLTSEFFINIHAY